MREDLLDHRRFQDRGDDPELTAALRAVLHVDLEIEASAQTSLYSSHVVAKTRLSNRAQLMRLGRTWAISPQIADELGLAPSTVNNHLGVIFRKLGVGSKLQLQGAMQGGSAATTPPPTLPHADDSQAFARKYPSGSRRP